ncbi:MAG: hypothetical protein C3F07_04760 [Anaerolineales bacterium]|nr:DinB family protein [Anaerolineae bacterium]PWB75649.1 MAG: hypothetical protein C3F07_04760 [Anaerolineales bacterium]
MDPNRKRWNEGHQKLNRALAAGHRDRAVELFIEQHAMHHAAALTGSVLWSFQDEILNDLTDEQIRRIPEGGEHSIAWILFHLARIEDITMNMLVAGTPQVFVREGWAKKLNVDVLHSANKMDAADVKELNRSIDLDALKAYRLAVGKRTREIVRGLKAEDFKKKVEPERIQKVRQEGAVIEEAMEVINYWNTRTIAGLLLMPATRHNILHLNEALRIRKQLLK